jgi:hypothetical protein
MSNLLGIETGEASIGRAAGPERADFERRCVERRLADRRGPALPEASTAWSSGSEILGYTLWASDGAIGRITDLCFEEESLTVTGIFALARRFLLSERIFVPLNAVTRIDASQRRVQVRLTRAQIRQLASRRDCES